MSIDAYKTDPVAFVRDVCGVKCAPWLWKLARVLLSGKTVVLDHQTSRATRKRNVWPSCS